MTTIMPLWPNMGFNNGPISQIQPFTYQDDVTYLDILYLLRDYIREQVVPQLNGLSEEVNSAVQALIAEVEAQLAAQNQNVTDQLATQNQHVTDQLAAQNQNVTDQLATQNQNVTDQLAAQDADVTTKIADMVTYVNNAVASIINNSIEVQDAVVNGIILDTGSETRQTTDALYAPLSTADYLKAVAALDAASVYIADFKNDRYSKTGIGLTKVQAFTDVSTFTRDANGNAVLARATPTNLLTLPLVGGATGDPVAGGSFPTGWGNASSGNPKNILAIDGKGFNVRLGPQSSGTYGGWRSPGLSPTTPTVHSFYVEGTNIPFDLEPDFLNLGWFNGDNLTNVSARIFWTWDKGRRVDIVLPAPAAVPSNASYTFSSGSGTPHNIETRFEPIGVWALSEVGDDPFGLPWYSTTPIPASNVKLKVDDGSYVVIGISENGRYLRKRVTAAGNAGIDLAAAYGWAKISKLWVIPNNSWDENLVNLTYGLDPKWITTSVRLSGPNPSSSATVVMQQMGHLQNVPNGDITPASTDMAALYSIKVADALPGRMQTEVHPGDRAPYDGPSQERAEIHLPNKLPFNTDIWLEDWITIQQYDPETSDKSVGVNQVRYTNDPGDTSALVPEFYTRVYSKATLSETPIPAGYCRLKIITASDPVSGNTVNPPLINDPTTTISPSWVIRVERDFKNGTRVHLLARIRFSNSGGGYLQAWLNGEQVYNAAAAIGYNRIQGPTARFGSYANTHVSSVRLIRHEEFGVSTTSMIDRLNSKAPL